MTNYEEFRAQSPFKLKAGGLYEVSLPNKHLGKLFLQLENGKYLHLTEGQVLMCVSQPKKITLGDVDNGFIQYWGVEFLFDEKLGLFSIMRPPMDLREFEYELNLRLYQIQ